MEKNKATLILKDIMEKLGITESDKQNIFDMIEMDLDQYE